MTEEQACTLLHEIVSKSQELVEGGVYTQEEIKDELDNMVEE